MRPIPFIFLTLAIPSACVLSLEKQNTWAREEGRENVTLKKGTRLREEMMTRLEDEHNQEYDDTVEFFSMASDLEPNSRAQVTMWYEGDEDLPSQLSVCMWFRTTYIHPVTPLVELRTPRTVFDIYLFEQHLVVCCKTGCTKPGKFGLNTPVSTWLHMCMVVTENYAALHLNGSTTRVTYDEDQYSPCANETSEGVWAKLGGDGFTGEVGDVRIIPGGVSLQDEIYLGSCKSLPHQSLRVTNFSLHGDVIRRQQSITMKCQNAFSVKPVAFWVMKNYTDANHFCEQFGGRLPAVDESNMFYDYYTSEMNFWLASNATDMCTGWIVSPVPRHSHLISQSCHRKASSVVCLILKEFRFQLKGTDVWDFSLVSHRGFPIFKNKDGFTISLEKNCPKGNDNRACAVMKEWGQIEKVAILPSDNIIGRYSWYSLCSNESEIEVLSMCTEDSFTCNDGHCIPIEQHCDSRPHCPDGSDEGPPSCVTARWPRTSDFTFTCYHPHPVIGFDLQVTGLHEVDLNLNEFQVTLNMTLSWTDPRLEFTDLQTNTKISKTLSDRFWKPDVFYGNAHFENNVEFFAGSSMLESFTLEPLQPGNYRIIDGYEALHFDGKNVLIKWNIKYLFTFVCGFTFTIFPFDVQECSMNILLPRLAGCQPVLDIVTPGAVRVIGYEHTFSMYQVPPPRFAYIKDNGDVVGISAKVLLYRKFQSYMLTTFLPCGILIALSNSTLTGVFLNNFSDRIMVTLSLLIVVASLFSQVVATLPSSVDIKYVDVYFFYCIIRLSFIYIIHSISGKMSQNPRENNSESNQSCTLVQVTYSSFSKSKTSRIAWNDEKPSGCVCQRPGAQAFDKFGNVFFLIFDIAFLCVTTAVIFQIRAETIRKFETNNCSDISSF